MGRIKNFLGSFASPFLREGILISATVLIIATDAAQAADQDAHAAACRERLSAVHRAIQEYRRAHQTFPERFADMIPRPLPKPEAVTCPSAGSAARRHDLRPTGGLAAGYVYEFEQRTLANELTRGLGVTQRTWRQWQMGRIGGRVPIVRCTNHSPALALLADGTVCDESEWRERFEALVPPGSLSVEKLVAENLSLDVVRIPAREPGTASEMLDLAQSYNGSLQGWLASYPGENLAGLQTGRARVGQFEFDARGVIQLGSRHYALMDRPAAISNILMGVRCHSLLFLHGTVYREAPGTKVSRITIHLDNGATEIVTLAYAQDVEHWLAAPGQRALENSYSIPQVARTGTSTRARLPRLHVSRWVNPTPQIPVRCIDFASLMTLSSPFLVAVTAETSASPALPNNAPFGSEEVLPSSK